MKDVSASCDFAAWTQVAVSFMAGRVYARTRQAGEEECIMRQHGSALPKRRREGTFT